MWKYKYGSFNDDQERLTKKYMQKQIYFLLLYVDEKTRERYDNINVVDAFSSIQTWFGGLNELLFYPVELVRVCSLLEAARKEYESEDFEFSKYRKLLLDAGVEVMKIKGVE